MTQPQQAAKKPVKLSPSEMQLLGQIDKEPPVSLFLASASLKQSNYTRFFIVY